MIFIDPLPVCIMASPAWLARLCSPRCSPRHVHHTVAIYAAKLQYRATMQDNAIGNPLAPLLIRVAAMIYESLLIVAVILVAALPFLMLLGNAEVGWRHFVFQLYLAGVLLLYFSAFWMRSGQTLAMKTWRIRLVGPGGGRLSFKQSVSRFALALSGLLLAGAGFWWALFDRDRQFLHDRLLGTRLVRVPRQP
jgi:uncharacterized RDD family membrane protein YckC